MDLIILQFPVYPKKTNLHILWYYQHLPILISFFPIRLLVWDYYLPYLWELHIRPCELFPKVHLVFQFPYILQFYTMI